MPATPTAQREAALVLAPVSAHERATQTRRRGRRNQCRHGRGAFETRPYEFGRRDSSAEPENLRPVFDANCAPPGRTRRPTAKRSRRPKRVPNRLARPELHWAIPENRVLFRRAEEKRPIRGIGRIAVGVHRREPWRIHAPVVQVSSRIHPGTGLRLERHHAHTCSGGIFSASYAAFMASARDSFW